MTFMKSYETHLNSKQPNLLTQHTVFRKDRDGCTHSSGGVAIVKKSIACHQVSVHTNLEAIAVISIIFGGLETVCSLYDPPDYHLGTPEFESLINQLQPPFILAGDCNAHHELWGSALADARGRVLEKVLLSSAPSFLTKNTPRITA